MAKRGRPRSFDRTVALERAMEVFWARGYEGASMADLTAAMGINAPSLYLCFESKEALFREAVAHYAATEGTLTMAALETAPTAREAIVAMLCGAVRAYTLPDRPPGCMIVTAAMTATEANESARQHLVECRQQAVETIRRRLDQGVADGDLAAGTDTEALAAFYATVLNGLSLLARDGAAPDKLNQVVTCALAAWDCLTGPGIDRGSISADETEAG